MMGCGSLTCGQMSRDGAVGDVWEQTSRDGAVGH